MKPCSRCDLPKSDDDFGWTKSAKGTPYRKAQCRQCEKEYQRRYRRDHREAYNTTRRNWRHQYPDKVLAINRRYYQRHPERRRLYYKRYQLNRVLKQHGVIR